MHLQPDSSDARGSGVPVRAVSRDRLYFSSLLCAASGLLFVVCVWLVFREEAAPISVCGAISILFCGGLALATRRRRIPRRYLPAAGAGLATAVYATLFYSFIVLRTPSFTLFLVMIVLAAGAMQSSAGWLVLTLAVTVAPWVVAGVVMFGAAFVPAATGLVFAASVALFVHLFVVRHLLHLMELRQRDRLHGEELAAALAAAHHELTERQRAEAERERLREQLLHSQKLEAVGTLAGGVAHDMNNMLAAILGLAEHARVDLTTAPEAFEQIIDAARRGSGFVRNLLGFSRRGQYRVERFELGSVVASITVLLSRTLPKEIELVSASKPGQVIEGDAAQLGQALLNLCLNASDAMEGRGVLRVEVGETMLAGESARSLGLTDGRYVTLAVSDTGCGMDVETRSRMFEPFFTTKPPGRGTGLGLAMVYGTITNHGGAIAVDSEPGRGTSIVLHLPAVEIADRPAPAAEPHVAQAPPVAGPTRPALDEAGLVLVVDDEPLLRRITRRSLERSGYRVLTASDGAEGLAVFQESAADIGVVLLDMAMPVMGGAECFLRMRAFDPRARVLLASGYALEEDARACLAAGALGFLEKPFASARLLEAVALALSDRRVEEHLTLPAVS